jgi:hypothetical protein
MEIGWLLRVKNMIDAARGSIAPSAASARALTESYGQLRIEVLGLVSGTDEEEEFDRIFPDIPTADVPNMRLAGNSGKQQHANLESEALRATALLAQLAGWVEGLIDEQLLERRIHAEAEAKARLEAKPRTGFRVPNG